MVMEAPPSPQSVGREFVRQYYTLLNQAPTHLHRFYNHQSSFIHGGLDPNRETNPVIGQKQIHQKIQQLNFRDCHAKITQVDSQATLGNGVVVQVTGELSNDGQPMRRFTQTFVLAAQSPKKYYVHNDIFRYQDEIISEDECENDVRSETEEDVGGGDRPVLTDVQHPVVTSYYPNTTPIQPQMPQIGHHPQTHVQPQVPTVNGAIHPEDINVMGHVATHVGPVEQQNQTITGTGPIPTLLHPKMVQLQQQLINQQPQTEEVQQQAVVEETNEDNLETAENDANEVDDQVDVPAENVSNEPKTYANLLKSGGGNVPYTPQASTLPTTQPLRSGSPPQTQHQGQRNNLNNRSGPRPNQARMPRQDSGRSAPGRNSVNDEGMHITDDRRRPQNSTFNDTHQLFLGHLPHTATEDELREIFSVFGTILDLRVFSKPNNKPGPTGNRAPPNYGFITYDSQESVQKCLMAKPIFYPKDDKSGTPLNVEEKKPKDRNSYGGGGGGGGGRQNTDNNRGGPRGDVGGLRRSMGGQGSGSGGGGGGGGMNRANNVGGSAGGPTRNNNYNRSGGGGGGPPNRGSNNYNRR